MPESNTNQPSGFIEHNFFVGVFWGSAFGILCWLMFALGYYWQALSVMLTG